MIIDIVNLLIQALAVILPSIITVATIAKKKYYKHTLQSIEQKIQIMNDCTQTKMKQIYDTLKYNGQIIQTFLEYRDVSSKLRQITRHALQCCTSSDTKKVLVKFTQQFTMFVAQVLELKVHTVSSEHFIAKLDVTIDSTRFYAKQFLSTEFIEGWLKISEPYFQRYKEQCVQLMHDKINNKSNRFIIKSLDLSHTLIKQYVLYSANMGCNINCLQRG